MFSRCCLKRRFFIDSTAFAYFSSHKRCVAQYIKEKNPEYLLMLDFEATCMNGLVIPNQEIIEFPCIKVKTVTMNKEAIFHSYVKPVLNPTLTMFCVDLTGILQETVDESPTFKEVLSNYDEWRRKENLTEENSLIVTSGNWDLGYMLPFQCQLSGVEIPHYFTQWADLKKIYCSTTDEFPRTLRRMVQGLNLPYHGRQHAGLDDCMNMYKITEQLYQKGGIFKPTSRYCVESKQLQFINS